MAATPDDDIKQACLNELKLIAEQSEVVVNKLLYKTA